MLIQSLNLIDGYPIGREDQQRAWIGFNESTPGALHRDPIWGDSRDPVVWARSRAEGNLQVFKLRVRSCRRWQLKVCKQFNELFAARHAPQVSLPASKPGRPLLMVIRPFYTSGVPTSAHQYKIVALLLFFNAPQFLDVIPWLRILSIVTVLFETVQEKGFV